jgi:hypothetical protein
MKKTLLVLSLFAFFQCAHSQPKRDLGVPDVVEVDGTKGATKFPGTNFFIQVPMDYTLEKQLLRFQKDGDTYIQLIQFPVHADFGAKRMQFEKYFSDQVASGKIDHEYYKKEFRLGGCQALLYYAKDNKPLQEQIMLLFGDTSFFAMAVGEFPSYKPVLRQEILNGLLSIYVDKTVAVDPNELANFTLDLRHTEFKFCNVSANNFYYTVDGKGNPGQDESLDMVLVQALPAFASNEEIQADAIRMLDNYRKMGIEVPNYVGKDTTINGNYAYQILFEGFLKGRKNEVYQIVTGNVKGSVLFMGVLPNRTDLMPQVKSIASSLKIK